MPKVFGVTASGGAFLVANGHQRGSSAEIAECRDEDGKVTDEKAYSREETASVEGVFLSEPPKAGESLTIGALTALAKESQVTEENTGYCRASVSIAKKDSSTQVAYS